MSDTNHGKMKVSISEKDPNGCEIEPMEKMEIDQKMNDGQIIEKSNEAMSNQKVPSTTKKNYSGHIKMSGYGIIASSDIFFLDAYQYWIYINSDVTTTGTIIGIPRKHAS